MDKEQVREAIHTAFADLPVPKPRTLILPLDAQCRPGGEEFRKALAGKNWQSLTPEFLARKWASFGYLSPKAYRYYSPSLLIAGLQEFPNDSGFLHSVVWALRPSFWLLYYEGEDSDLRYQQSAFTEAQYCALCGFLGLIFDQIPGLRHLSAQALHWGWNQHDTPALQAAKTYYHELRNFSYPIPDDPDVAPLCQEIRTAFAVTPYPGDNELSGGSDQNVQDDEPAEYAMELRGVRWQAAHPELLARCYAALSFLSDAGFRYFLPAFLLADLLGYNLGYESNANPLFDLTNDLYDSQLDVVAFAEFRERIATGDSLLESSSISRQEMLDMVDKQIERRQTFDGREYRIRRLSLFNHKERMAIIHYLEFQATQEDYYADKIRQVLDGYWQPSLQSSVE